MNAIVLLGTLKRTGVSNTEVLCEFLARRMKARGIETEIIRLVDHDIPPGTYSHLGPGDDWPRILKKILDAPIIILATPIWWNNQSSLIQRVIERLDELHDHLMAGKPSGLEGKVGGIVITGDSDGAQTIIGNLCNFFNAIGLMIPPFATLSVLWEGQAKGQETTPEELMQKYEADYAGVADKMIKQLLESAQK